jgi:Flp pilus assembly secretin CpaC
MKRLCAIGGLLLGLTLLWLTATAQTPRDELVRSPAAAAGSQRWASEESRSHASQARSSPRSRPVEAVTRFSPGVRRLPLVPAQDTEPAGDFAFARTATYPTTRYSVFQPGAHFGPVASQRSPLSEVSSANWRGVDGSHNRPAQRTLPEIPQELLAPAPSPDVVTLHLNEVDVRQAFELLSRSHGVNVLVAPGVQGQVTANFEQANVDETIHAILKLCNLVAVREDNLLYVYSVEEYPQSELQLRVIPLDFAAATDILPGIQGLLSKVGSVSAAEVDSADNRRTRDAITVTDIPSSIERIEQYVVQMDQAPRQVVIEAHVLEVELGEGCRHGINYEQMMKLAGSEVKLDLVGFAEPLASPAVFASLKGGDVDALLHILKSTSDTKTLASPRLMVINGQRARLQVGEQLGYKVITVTETASVEEVKFLDVGVVLDVTPRISRDGRILLRVEPKVSDGEINPDTELPEEETRQLETDVLLRDGQGVVIGGLIQERDIDVEKKLPILGNLPVVGWVFRKWEVTKKRTEILITLVPRICQHEIEYDARDAIDLQRTHSPLFHGPLERCPRPWEATLPGTARNPERFRDYLRRHRRDDGCIPGECLPPQMPEYGPPIESEFGPPLESELAPIPEPQ